MDTAIHTTKARHRFQLILGTLAVLFGLTAFGQFYVSFTNDPPRPMVDEWEIRFRAESLSFDRPIPLSGRFICTPEAVEANPTVQFSSALSEDGLGGWTVSRPTNPALTLARTCGGGEWVDFEYAWDDGLRQAVASVIEDGDLVEVRISVAAVGDDGWLGATTIAPAIAFDH